ncbi:MAG: heavy metal-binding domain-containing protein, partial [Methylocystis silviterrae]
MTRVGHEHRHDHASHEESRSARAGGATEDAAHGDTHASNVIYTCPMHPQIRQIGPGNCPICGMTLEPLVASTEVEPNAELIDMTRRFWIGLALAAPVLVLEMGGHLFNLHHLLAPQASNWLQLILATPVVLWAGWPFFVRGAQSL